MLDSEQVKNMLSTDDIIRLCCDLQEDDTVLYDAQGNPIFSTCLDHEGGDSWKCYYYPESKIFHTYTSGKSKDIFQVVQQVKGFDEFIDAFNYVVRYFNLKDNWFTEKKELTSDWDILQQAKDYEEAEVEENKIPIIPMNMLDYFYPLAAPIEWQQEGISPEVMLYYGIRIDSALQHIIIKQVNEKGELIGIRRRSFDPIEVEEGKKYMPVFIEGQCYNTPTSKTLYGIYENKETIKQMKKVLLVEGEKSVLQLATMYGVDHCYALAVYGSALSQDHIQTLLDLQVDEVIIGFDHEFTGKRGEADEHEYEQKLLKLARPLLPYMKVSLILDVNNLTPYKASPTDCGKEIFEQLYRSRNYVYLEDNKIITKMIAKKK